MSIPIDTVLKIAQSILLPDEQIAINVFWALLGDAVGGGPLAESDVIDAAANYLDLIYAEIDDMISDLIASTVVEVWTVDEPTGDLTPVGDGATTWVGLDTNDPLPNGVAGICSMKTDNTEVTGRKFIPGINEVAVDDNNLDTIPFGRLLDFAVEWATEYTDANDVVLSPGVYSGAKANFYAATGTVIANNIVGYQRRRKPGVGS
jgi:hypothetical protein